MPRSIALSLQGAAEGLFLQDVHEGLVLIAEGDILGSNVSELGLQGEHGFRERGVGLLQGSDFFH